MSPKIFCIVSSNSSLDALALNTSRLGRYFPHGVLKVAMARDAGSSLS